MFTLAQLKAAVIERGFPNKRAPEWVLPHNKLFISAMVAVQQAVPCLQNNNTQIVNFCDTLFQCGMTVLDAPRGIIRKVSTYARLDSECAEDADQDISWCSEVQYARTEFPLLKKTLDRQLGCRCNSSFAALANLSIPACQKVLGQAYPAPTDEGFEGYPELPLGFHYPQDSTDTTFRAKSGVWAMERGRIYIAPWINSSEVVVIEWDGVKRTWVDADIVDEEENQLLIDAVYHYLMIGHYRDIERDLERQRVYEREYQGDGGKMGSLEALIHQCREETRARVPETSHARLSDNTIG